MTVIAIDPCPAPRMVQSDKWSKRPCVQKYFLFRENLFYAFGSNLPVPCELIFTIAMPAGWSAKKKASMQGKPHCQRPDIDNLAKAVFDSLLKEDSHVWACRLSKVWGASGSIEIRKVGT